MIHVFCLIATEDRLWNMRRALRSLDRSYPGLLRGHCWSVRELCSQPEKIAQMLEDSDCCDYGIVYFHGGAQSLVDFHLVWNRLTGHMPVYFESSLPDEVAQLLPSSGMTPDEYQAKRTFDLCFCISRTMLLERIAMFHRRFHR